MYSGTPLNGHPWSNPWPLYNGQEPRSQMNSLCTKQPLNKGHPYITSKIWFPKGGRYRGIPLYTTSFNYKLHRANKQHARAVTGWHKLANSSLIKQTLVFCIYIAIILLGHQDWGESSLRLCLHDIHIVEWFNPSIKQINWISVKALLSCVYMTYSRMVQPIYKTDYWICLALNYTEVAGPGWGVVFGTWPLYFSFRGGRFKEVSTVVNVRPT